MLRWDNFAYSALRFARRGLTPGEAAVSLPKAVTLSMGAAPCRVVVDRDGVSITRPSFLVRALHESTLDLRCRHRRLRELSCKALSINVSGRGELYADTNLRVARVPQGGLVAVERCMGSLRSKKTAAGTT